MALLTVENSMLQRDTAVPIYRHLADLMIAEINSGGLVAGDKLPTEHNLAKQLGINRLTVRKSYQVLEAQNLVERRRGVGTFVMRAGKDAVAEARRQNDDAIYFLITHPIHITLQLENSLIFRRIVYGASMANSGRLVQTLPVSKKMEDKLKHIDWDALRQIPEGGQVFVHSLWFRELFPFLLGRNVRGIFFDDQFERTLHVEDFKRLADANWSFITLDRLSAMENTIEYLYSLGRRRIAVIKAYRNEPQHPFRLGMMTGYERCGMIFDKDLYCETASKYPYSQLDDHVVELLRKTNFDALVVGSSDMTKTVYETLVDKLGLSLPEDVALMSFYDHPDYLGFAVPVTAVAFPYAGVGREIVRLFDREGFPHRETVFQATIIERESTRKGAGVHVNHALMPEVPANDTVGTIRV